MGIDLPSYWWSLRAVDLFVLGMAVWRISSLVTNEDGPWFILARIRHWIGVRMDEHSKPFGTNIVAEAVTCVWCASVWVSLLVVGSYLLFPKPTYFVSLLCSGSTIAILIERILNYD